MPTRAALLVLVAVVITGCAGAAPGATQQTGATQQPGATLAPGATQAPGSTPAGTGGVPNTSTCNLVTTAEMSTIWGVQMSAVPDSKDNTCTWAAATGLPSLSIRFEQTDLTTAKAILTNEADVTVSGNPGVIGAFMGVILYVQRGSVDLVVQTVLTEDTPDNRAKVVATAEKALSRMP
jgi:Protein of unknown function (DUF3558)